MQVTKLRSANDNGLVPAGRYFARLADNLRSANDRTAAVVDEYEKQERKLEARHRKRCMPARTNAHAEHAVIM